MSEVSAFESIHLMDEKVHSQLKERETLAQDDNQSAGENHSVRHA
jgi:hypothetical protein